MKILRKYNELKLKPSDINEHLVTLKEYAERCDHVTEMGVRDVVSTYAFLASQPQKMVSYDINYSACIEDAKQMANEKGLDFNFIQADVLKIDIEETDLLFIDTLHIYSQLKKELDLHANKVRKYLIFHDTVTYGHKDEPTDWQTDNIMENYEVKDKKGLMTAISEFLADNKEWSIEAAFGNNNGLLILKNINNVK